MSEPVLLYDGLCGFCNTTVQFILGHERRNTLRFSPLQGAFAAALHDRHPELRKVDSLVWVEGVDGHETLRVRSAAAIRVGGYLGGGWKLAALILWLVPRPIRDFAYDQFARRRTQFFGRYGSCPVPSREVRTRFLA
jgi:predicted DCC family thiol-disulfide oxidoreductase YuxK